MVLFGVDRVAEFENLFTGRVALLTGPSGRTSGNVPTIDVLKQCCNLRLLLAPEHGVRGDKAAGALFADEIDEGSGLPVRSLYTKDSKRLSRETLAFFDTLVYDIADVGCRYYTFLTTLRYCIEDCAAAGKRLVVLDRPNPLGDRVEGGIVRPDVISFVGAGGDDEPGAALRLRPAYCPLRRAHQVHDLPGLGPLLGHAKHGHSPV